MLAVRTVMPARKRRSAKGLMTISELAAVTELRARGPEQEVRFLSGGNQQKVVLSKWLETQPQILIFDEPTRGIDVGAKAGIHELMRELARAGAAILMISSELPEVIGMSDRILVMRDGTIAGELPAGASEAQIMLLATGERETVVAA
jgi:ABC-type sugar transport system ATPase subunit